MCLLMFSPASNRTYLIQQMIDLSHSRTIIEIQGDLVNEVLKKGCPINIDKFSQGDCTNSIYNGISITIDFISNNNKHYMAVVALARILNIQISIVMGDV